MIFGTALPKKDLYYYVALTVLFLIIAYVIYTESSSSPTSSSFSLNNYLEGFSVGGGGSDKDKKEKPGKEKKSKTGKLVEQINDQNDSLEESLKISDNKNDYSDLLSAYKRNISLELLNTISKGGTMPSTFNNMEQGFDKLIEFVESE